MQRYDFFCIFANKIEKLTVLRKQKHREIWKLKKLEKLEKQMM